MSQEEIHRILIGRADLRMESPIVAVVGKVVDLAQRLHWFGRPPKPLAFLELEEWLNRSRAEAWASA